MLVFDDVHWAEPTFLELVEHLAEKGEASILVVCMAREELLEDRPEFLDGLANADRIVLDALSADETDALLDGLGGGSLESDQRGRIVATAEGNPFFLEQLSRSRWRAGSPTGSYRRRSRRCSRPASTGSARGSGPCSSAHP